MSLEITNVENVADTVEKEYVRLVATAGCNLSDYAIVDKTFSKGLITNIHRHFYRMPNIIVEQDDIVRAYTGVGDYRTNKIKSNNKEVTVHHIYCGSDAFVWNNDGDTAYLYKLTYIGKKETPKRVKK